MKEKRRDFLKKSLIASAATTVALANECCNDVLNKHEATNESNGVICGKAAKKEVLYSKNQLWDQYYKIAK
ncbi:twin-arginine translocation signal domain-containing protein [Campylobacter sp. FMV-PI01]|uniref:Twin-arginine translocation signal domain-containing protein n=1 Tax=Campylobacter portucalensis TaxID=2608384 RepID=A0A6L5WJD6_9BACT|nr:twin-arginine translocation signal domain-containing protein [Campylobacter portucalensis]MSN95953.1 twin-arginine translocation signal domain-containing protein [Campylobacter portucalensis]